MRLGPRRFELGLGVFELVNVEARLARGSDNDGFVRNNRIDR